jgi:ureidoglycolate hydrolase
MSNMLISLEPLSKEEFMPYGIVTDFNEDSKTLESTFHVYLKMATPGWAIAKSVVRHRSIDKIAQHPTTKEAFIPLSGVGAIVVASPEKPDELRAFVLDRPIIIHENVWHVTIALSAVAEFQVIENPEVTHNMKSLPGELIPMLGMKL